VDFGTFHWMKKGMHDELLLIIYQFSTNRGGWDTEGVTTVSVTDDTITCNSSHLTSFAVLVDVAGSHKVCLIELVYFYNYLLI